MKLSANQTVLLTGASGGLGTHITRELASLDLNLALVAFSDEELTSLKPILEQNAIQAFCIVADLTKKNERERVVEQVIEKYGKIDILINNAGIEFIAPYHELSQEEISEVIDVNLVAPMQLARLVIPHMLKHGAGHIVNMSSLAGKASPAYQEAYAATKAGLIAFTTSLRETHAGQGISASAICPGFVEAGIYARLKENTDCSAPVLLGTSPPQKVAKAVVRAINKNLPQLIVNPLPVKPLLVISEISPRV